MSKFAKTLVKIARRREAERNAILSERAKRDQEVEEKRRAEELAERQYDEDIFREAQRQDRLEDAATLRQIQSETDYKAGLWLTLILRKNLEIGLGNLERFLHDISHSGLSPDLLDRLSYLTRLAGDDVKSYEEIGERVRPILMEESKEQLRKKLEGNSFQGYFVNLLR